MDGKVEVIYTPPLLDPRAGETVNCFREDIDKNIDGLKRLQTNIAAFPVTCFRIGPFP